MKTDIALLLFEDTEVLDFAGPFEVFSVTDELHQHQFYNIYTVGLESIPVKAKNGLQVVPDYCLSNCPAPEILIIPGGSGTRALLENADFLDWIRCTAASCKHVLSVCSGSLVLAKCGLLAGLGATTHHQVLAELEELAPDSDIFPQRRFVDNGKIITSAGISAGIDMSLYVVGLLHGPNAARKTAQYMEYPLNTRANNAIS
ncbi:DJ-1/PfpI family protein [Desulfosediminicola ganghwensis]|uniref:DJ-1/PfpI family protein n=1 Tax=Desulfosediminicola ganghwensis TaxID=2569540 RepID=UPI0010ABD1C5|nr:DJ-1/PfpI family protein [Desulfosediminicola ganghwensis]